MGGARRRSGAPKRRSGAPTRRAFLGALTALPGWIARPRALPPRPARLDRGGSSLLVLVADDTSRLNIGAFGNRSVTTPRVDELAAEGLRCERAYTPVAVCEPARASLYTGLYPCGHGALGFDPVRSDVATWPEILGPEGIATGLIGKVHVEPESKFPFEFLATGDAFLEERDPEAFAGAFADFLSRAGERRFAGLVSFKDPHRPFGFGKEESEGGPPRLHDPANAELFPFLWDTPGTREDLARYCDALARMDATLARVLDVLEASGRAEETLVVFTSDNGMPFPYAKATLYEAGINLPLIARWPGRIAPGETSDALVGLIDILPTALELFGLSGPKMHGHSLLPLLSGGDSAKQAVLRTDWFAMHTSQKVGEDYPSRSIRSGDLKYIRNLKPEATYRINAFNSSRTWQSWRAVLEERDEPALAAHMERLLHRPAEELYDLAADPFEATDLARDPARAEELARLRGLLEARMREFGDREGLALLEGG